VIVLDTHIWVMWVHGDSALPKDYSDCIQQEESNGLGISAISCWEVAKLVELGRLSLPLDVEQWFEKALSYPGVRLLELTPRIALESTRLPGRFHRDPADQIIVATSRVYDCPIVTLDARILAYPHVKKAP
jgi:PIN domain nuclease of toxin-antitoxin system